MRHIRWALVVALLLAACSSSDDDDSADEPPPGAPPDSEPEAITITVDDAELGSLTFDALAAGDPDAAADGRLVLLLHGFPETSESYREILPALAAEGYYAVAPDQRGYSPGARPAEVADYQILHMVDDTLAMADELGADDFHLVGHDWGGGVAWVTAALHPDRISTLAALSTPHPDALSASFTAPGSEQPEMSSYVGIFAAPGSEATFLPRETFVAAFSSSGMPEAKAEAYADVLATEEALGAALDWYRANPIPSEVELGPVDVPTLYVWGSEDLALGRTAAEGTADHVDAAYEFVELEGEGHWLPETATDEVTDHVLSQLSG